MIHDALLELSDSQAVTVSAASENVIDQLTAGQPIGKECYWLEIRVAEAVTAADDATVSFFLETDDAEDFNTKVVLAASGPMRKPDLNINVLAWRIRIPPGAKQFLRIHYTVTDGPLTAGKFDTYFVLDTQGDDTLRAATPWGPLDLGPTAGFATHRMPCMACTHIMNVRRVNAGDNVDVYDFQQNTSNYKLSAGGEWIDGSAESFYIRFWYDQTGHGNHVELTAYETRQASVLLDDNSGWPVVYYNGANNGRLSSIDGKTMSDHIGVDSAGIIVYGAFMGAPHARNGIINLPTAAVATGLTIGVFRGIYPVGGDDRVWFLNTDGSFCEVGVVYSVDTWYVFALDHQGGTLSGYKDGSSIENTPSGSTPSLNTAFSLGKGAQYTDNDHKQAIVLTFDIALSGADHLAISDYCKAH